MTRLVVVDDHRVEARRADLRTDSNVIAFPLTEVCDDETPPFPLLTYIPGTATDEISSNEALVIYRVLRSGSQPTGNGLAAARAADGVELTY